MWKRAHCRYKRILPLHSCRHVRHGFLVARVQDPFCQRYVMLLNSRRWTSILSCIGHKNENLIDLYMIDIFMVRVGKWKLCMLKQCCYWDVELKLLYHCVRHRHCNDSRILWNSQKNGSPPSLPCHPNIIRPLSRFHSVSRPLSLFLSFLLSDLSVTSYHLLSQTYRHSHL